MAVGTEAFVEVTNHGGKATLVARVDLTKFGHGNFRSAYGRWDGVTAGRIQCTVERGISQRIKIAEAKKEERAGLSSEDDYFDPYPVRYWRVAVVIGAKIVEVESNDAVFEDTRAKFGELLVAVVAEPEAVEGASRIRLSFVGDEVRDIASGVRVKLHATQHYSS